MIEIRELYFNAREIRELSRTTRGNLVITFINGDIRDTDFYYGDIEFKQLIEQWKECLK